MKRFILEVENSNPTIRYAKELKDLDEKVGDLWGENRIIKIYEDTKMEYVALINQIINSSINEERLFNKCKEVYQIKYNNELIYVKFWYDFIIDGDVVDLMSGKIKQEDIINAERYYFSTCEFQRHNENKLAFPIGWEWISVEDFYNMFIQLENKIELSCDKTISHKEFKKIKATKFYNKNNRQFFFDDNGYFYYINKKDLPTKRKKDEYKLYKNNKDAVKMHYQYGGFEKNIKVKWFSSIEEFKLYRQNLIDNHNPVMGSYFNYKVIKKGCNLKNPEEVGIVFRLPYFKLEQELEYESTRSGNKNSINHIIAKKWALATKDMYAWGNWVECEDFIVQLFIDLIVRYLEYKEQG